MTSSQPDFSRSPAPGLEGSRHAAPTHSHSLHKLWNHTKGKQNYSFCNVLNFYFTFISLLCRRCHACMWRSQNNLHESIPPSEFWRAYNCHIEGQDALTYEPSSHLTLFFNYRMLIIHSNGFYDISVHGHIIFQSCSPLTISCSPAPVNLLPVPSSPLLSCLCVRGCWCLCDLLSVIRLRNKSL